MGISDFPARYCPVCRHVVRRGFKDGPGGRRGALCPRCRSLERHRFFALLLGVLRPRLQDLGVLVDIAPAPQTTEQLQRLAPRAYVRMDLATPRGVDVQASLTELPLADASVDLLVCYHVLEHVPDDRAAMREIARVLSDDGLALLQVPWRAGPTEEDPDAPPEERARRFGLADHVRQYGDDFEDRLVECGLSVERVDPVSLLGSEAAEWMALGRTQVWVVQRSARPTRAVAPAAETDLTVALDTLLRELAQARRDVRRQRRDAAATD
jgi:SAM-dependent methyltransferase